MSARDAEIDARLELCARLLREDELLAREFEASQREFFVGALRSPAARDELARRRHLEWFLLERASSQFEGLAVTRVAELFPDRAGLDDESVLMSLVGSQAGLFEVTGVEAEQGAWIRDLTSHGEYALHEPEASGVLVAGDLISGRIFPLEGGENRLSRAADLYRNADLMRALRADIESARAGRRGVQRISQAQLERMFHADEALLAKPDDAVGEVRRLLIGSGVAESDVEGWLERLAQEPYDGERILLGQDDVLGEVLDELAFETAVDLTAARQALLFAWRELAERGGGRGASLRPFTAPRRPAESTPSVENVLSEFDAQAKAGKPLGGLLAELEQKLGLEDDEEDSPVPDFPGVVGAMVLEFVWEESLSDPVAARESARLELLGRSLESVGVFENLSAGEVLQFVTDWLPEHGGLAHADEARALLAALSRFARWAELNHEVALIEGLTPHLAALSSSLPRIVEANQRRTRTARVEQGEWFEVTRVERGAGPTGVQLVLRADEGASQAASVDPDLATWLAVGDRVRGRLLHDGRLSVYCCYPPRPTTHEPQA